MASGSEPVDARADRAVQGARHDRARSAAFVFRQSWVIPVLGVFVGAGALLGPGGNPFHRLFAGLVAPRLSRRDRRRAAVDGPGPGRARGRAARRRDRPAAHRPGRRRVDRRRSSKRGVAAVAATTGVHLGVVALDRLRRRSEAAGPCSSYARRAPPTSVIAPSTTTAADGAARLAPDGDRRSRAPRAPASTPLRTIAHGPTGASRRAAPKHRHGTWRACARTSTTVNAARSSERDDARHRAPPRDERDRDDRSRPPAAPTRPPARARSPTRRPHLRAQHRRLARCAASRSPTPRARPRARPAPRGPATRRSTDARRRGAVSSRIGRTRPGRTATACLRAGSRARPRDRRRSRGHPHRARRPSRSRRTPARPRGSANRCGPARTRCARTGRRPSARTAGRSPRRRRRGSSRPTCPPTGSAATCDDDFAAQNNTSGGSSDTDVNELHAMPTGSSPSIAVTSTTPVAK